MPAGRVYLVPVPIGNLGDITQRALETLKSVALIAAEDTRKTRFLLSQYGIKPPRLLSLHKYNEKQRLAEILALLDAGSEIAVVTDAGSPGISDPALLLIQAAIAKSITITPLPGPTALIPAVTVSGLDCSEFQFLGFLPLKLKERRLRLDRVRDHPSPSVLYEAPHRVRRTLEDLFAHCGNREICLAREISKLYEEFIRGDLEMVLRDWTVTEKGEFVIVVAGRESAVQTDDDEIGKYIDERLSEAASLKSLALEVAERFSVSRNHAYQLVLSHRNKEE